MRHPLFGKDFDLHKWGNLHHPHVSEDHPHPVGVGKATSVQTFRSYRLSREHIALFRKSEDFQRHIQSFMRAWLFRYAKHGHIAISDTFSMTTDRSHLYIHYEAIEVEPKWACLFTVKVLSEVNDRRESSEAVEEAVGQLKSHIDRVEREGRRERVMRSMGQTH